MKLCLVNPPINPYFAVLDLPVALLIALNTPGYCSPAIRGLRLYAGRDAALMKQCRIFTAEYDTLVQDQSILNNIRKLHPDMIAFSCYLWNPEKSLALARAVKSIFPEIKVVFGGQEVTNSTSSYLQRYPFLDIIFDGEGGRDVLSSSAVHGRRRFPLPCGYPGHSVS